MREGIWVQVKGQGLPGGEVKMSGSVSSQYLTALLMSAPLALDDIKITYAPVVTRFSHPI